MTMETHTRTHLPLSVKQGCAGSRTLGSTVRDDPAMTTSQIWELHQEGRAVARLHVTEADFPWLNATVERCDGYEHVEQLFQEELRQLNLLEDEETPEWTATYERIRFEMRLIDPSGRAVAEFLLHIDGDQAWWRWEDEPFTA
jgi:hypothetical protein